MRALLTGGRLKALLFIIMMAAVPLLPAFLKAQSGSVLTPASAYSEPAWGQKAQKYRSNLERVHKNIASKYKPGKIHFLTTAEAKTGGVGFWPSPVRYGDPSRYLGIFARVEFPPPSTGRAFPDTQVGRIMTIMDAYGKNSIGAIAQELKSINDPGVVGAVMIFIYAKKPVTDPSFEKDAEALALFMPKDGVIKFAELRMTVHSLFSQSEMLPVFVGEEQIKNLRYYIIQP